jgi:hypothetical protein
MIFSEIIGDNISAESSTSGCGEASSSFVKRLRMLEFVRQKAELDTQYP